MFDAIVVGSGAAGVFAAYQLRPLKVLLLDAGLRAPTARLPDDNIYDLRQAGVDLTTLILGERFEALVGIQGSQMSPKLKAPLIRFVTEKPRIGPVIESDTFDAVVSYARGGLANAWGAGVLRYNDDDLVGFPFSASSLDPYYSVLTDHIGVNGADDDLGWYLGDPSGLQSPLPLSPISQRLLSRYTFLRGWLRSRGITAGRTRAAILTQAHRGRLPYRILGQDFFQPNNPAIYHPGYTLNELIAAGQVTYESGVLVDSFEEDRNGVSVRFRDLDNNASHTARGRKLLLAAGAINSARIVLAAAQDVSTRVPLLDNPVTFIPLVDIANIGTRLAFDSFAGGELLVVYSGPLSVRTVQGSFYSLNAPLRADLLRELPLAMRDNLVAVKYLLPAMAMLQVFYSDEPRDENYLTRTHEGTIRLRYQRHVPKGVEPHLMRSLALLGFLTLPRLCQRPAPGSSIHYAGTLPMRTVPRRQYETDRHGLLFGRRHVHVCDASTFPRLPAKNHTFTIMANAMRIAEAVKSAILNSPQIEA